MKPSQEELNHTVAEQHVFDNVDIEVDLEWLAGKMGRLSTARPKIVLASREKDDIPRIAFNVEGLSLSAVIHLVAELLNFECKISDDEIVFTVFTEKPVNAAEPTVEESDNVAFEFTDEIWKALSEGTSN